MQIITVFNMTPQEYIKKFESLTINRPEKCQKCGVYHSFHSHGCYWRNLLDDVYEERIPVVRFCCKVCNQTVSVLPSFALPYFQYSLEFIIKALSIILKVIADKLINLPALFSFYKQRFFKNLIRIEMFFRDSQWLEASPSDEKQKAIKLICMFTFPKAEIFSQRFHKQYKRCFMAR